MAPTQDKTSPEAPVGGSERRRRRRLEGTTEGWLVPDTDGPSRGEPWEVRVHDVSRHGVGFESSEQLASGEVVRIRIGRGPIELARRVRIIRCNPGKNGTFRIGAEFV
jgi:hypothetical protein